MGSGPLELPIEGKARHLELPARQALEWQRTYWVILLGVWETRMPRELQWKLVSERTGTHLCTRLEAILVKLRQRVCCLLRMSWSLTEAEFKGNQLTSSAQEISRHR